MKDQLIAAARLAREASQGRRTIEIVVTEDGVIVRGRTTSGEGDEARTHKANRAVGWPEMSSVLDLVSNAVSLVDRELSSREA